MRQTTVSICPSVQVNSSLSPPVTTLPHGSLLFLHGSLLSLQGSLLSLLSVTKVDAPRRLGSLPTVTHPPPVTPKGVRLSTPSPPPPTPFLPPKVSESHPCLELRLSMNDTLDPYEYLPGVEVKVVVFFPLRVKNTNVSRTLHLLRS